MTMTGVTSDHTERMNGYGSILNRENNDEAVIDIEPSHDEEPAEYPPRRLLPSSIEPLLIKFGFVFLGFILGYVPASVSTWSGSARTSNSFAQDIYIDAQHQFQERVFSDSIKPFIDALPFEELYPRQLWNPVQISPTIIEQEDKSQFLGPKKNNASDHEQSYSKNELRTTIDVVGSKSTFHYFKSLLTSPVSSLLSTSSISTKAHILYLANEAAFSLLYDSSNPKNYYLSEYSLDYFLLTSGGFDAQINQAYCAVASVSALLNSLKYAKRFRDGDSWTFDLPVDSLYDPYPYATQVSILKGDCVQNTVIGHDEKDGSLVYGIFKPPYGLNLEQTSNLIKCHISSSDWDVSFQEVDPTKIDLSKMRYDLKAALIDPDARVLINYDRKMLNQVGGGHFSPVGAYHAATDGFLIMDVAKYKYPPVWVGADTLFDAMATVDNCGDYDFPVAQNRLGDVVNNISEYKVALDVLGCKQRMRGYIILKKKTMDGAEIPKK